MRRRILATTGAALLAALCQLPRAQAADSTAHGPEATVAALWRSMSHPPGGRADVARMRTLFHRDAVVFGSRLREGQASIRRSEAGAMLAAADEDSDAGFHECEIARTVQVFDRFATVYSVVESRTDPSAARPDFTGVNSLQLYRDDDGWKIVSLYYHVGPADLPIPDAEGRSGDCLG